jgi:hypothetical protein
MNGKDINLELAASGAKSRETWRDLAHSIEKENDPAKIIELARQLVTKIDEEGFGGKT